MLAQMQQQQQGHQTTGSCSNGCAATPAAWHATAARHRLIARPAVCAAAVSAVPAGVTPGPDQQAAAAAAAHGGHDQLHRQPPLQQTAWQQQEHGRLQHEQQHTHLLTHNLPAQQQQQQQLQHIQLPNVQQLHEQRAQQHHPSALEQQTLPDHTGTATPAAAADGTPELDSSSPQAAASAGKAYLLRLLQCQPAKLASLCTREVRLLSASQAQLQQGLAQLAGVLRVPLQQAAAAARKHPRLLFTPPNVLVAALSALQDALGLPRSKALRLVVQKPGLLLTSPRALSQQLRGLEAALRVGRADVRRLAIRAPIVLQETSPATTASKVQLLARELGLGSVQQTLRLLCDAPVLLDYSAQSLAGKLAHLRQLLAAVPTRASEAASAATAAAAGDAVAEQQASAGDSSSGGSSSSSATTTQRDLTSELRRVVLLEPSLLTRSSRDLQHKVDALSELTGLQPPQACSLVCARPSIVTRSSRAVGGTWRALSIWRLPHGVKVRLIEEHPVLLRLSSQELHGRCRWLRSLMLRNGLYHTRIRSLQPSRLGALLLHLPAVWPRLEYLLQSGREGAVKLSQAVGLSEAQFCRRFPEYSQWRSWNNGEEQAQEAPWRVEQQKKQQERQQRRQRRQGRYRSLPRTGQQQQQAGDTADAAADAGSGGSGGGSIVAWRQKALGGNVTVHVGRLKVQRPVRVAHHLTGSKARSGSGAGGGGGKRSGGSSREGSSSTASDSIGEQ